MLLNRFCTSPGRPGCSPAQYPFDYMMKKIPIMSSATFVGLGFGAIQSGLFLTADFLESQPGQKRAAIEPYDRNDREQITY